MLTGDSEVAEGRGIEPLSTYVSEPVSSRSPDHSGLTFREVAEGRGLEPQGPHGPRDAFQAYLPPREFTFREVPECGIEPLARRELIYSQPQVPACLT